MKLISEGLVDTCAVQDVPHRLAIGWLLDDLAAVVQGKKPVPPELAVGYDGLMAQVIVEEALQQTRARRRKSQSSEKIRAKPLS